jgi:hypothetical protein
MSLQTVDKKLAQMPGLGEKYAAQPVASIQNYAVTKETGWH